MASTRSLVIIGGGIAGLAAALEASSQGDVSVTVVDAAPRCGGKLSVGDLAGVTIDLGAESLLNTRPEAVALAQEVGLGDHIVHPETPAARLLSRGALRSIPAGLVMGAPSDFDAVVASEVLDAHEIEALRRGLDTELLPLIEDVGIGEFVGGVLGRGASERLVDPLLAGVYAGDADRISLQAAAPSLFASALKGGRFADVVERARRTPSGPVFAGLSGGIGAMPDATVTELLRRGVTVRTSTAATALAPTAGGGWSVSVIPLDIDGDGGPGSAEQIAADRVILAVPAFASSALLSTLPTRGTPIPVYDAMRALDAIPYADVAVLSFAFPLDEMPAAVAGSGFLIPSAEGRFIKASTFSSNKWEWTGDAAAAAGLFILRASVGRFGEQVETFLDDQLLERAITDLREILPGLPAPTDARVDRWPQSLPQYLVGHLESVARIRAALTHLPGLAVAGAAYDGIGIAACVASGRSAASAALAVVPST